MTLRDYFPPSEPYQTGMLAVDDLHNVYWEQAGNPRGAPILFLHGGPGAGCSPSNRQFFDPSHWRIILFDQRGCGRSTPLGETRHNTTEDLIADIEKLREHLGIENWHIFGGSWGSTLAIAYGEAHPSRCLGFILRGIFLLQKHEVDWYVRGLRHVHPEAYDAFASIIPVEERDNIIAAYLRRLQDPDPQVRQEATRRMLVYELTCATTEGFKEEDLTAETEARLATMPLLEAHYMTNNLPIPDSKYMDQVSRISHLPAIIVQGRYDMICPIATAYDLHKNWPGSEFIVVENAGHSAFEPSIRSALIAATEKMKSISSG